jgi:hypothetical protein
MFKLLVIVYCKVFKRWALIVLSAQKAVKTLCTKMKEEDISWDVT